MRRNLGVVASAVTLLMVLGSSAAAQTSNDATRQASSTFLGDTGLWFVPTAEILPDGKRSTTGQRVNFDRQEGITDIQHYLGLVPPPSPRRPVSGYDRLLSAAGNYHAPGNP